MRPQKIPFRRRLARASVALIYRQSEDGGVELLFIQRARQEGGPWSGDVAFPGEGASEWARKRIGRSAT